MRIQDIQVTLTCEEQVFANRLGSGSNVICMRGFTPLVVGTVLETVMVASTVLATIEFKVTDRVLARILNASRGYIDQFLETAEYSLAIDRYSHNVAIAILAYKPDELDNWDFDDEGWPI